MDRFAVLEGTDLAVFLTRLQDASRPPITKLRLAVDAGLKVKVNEGMWWGPLGRIAEAELSTELPARRFVRNPNTNELAEVLAEYGEWLELVILPDDVIQKRQRYTALRDRWIPEVNPNGRKIMLRFGYNRGLPTDADTAWGCRANVDQAGSVDIPPDRTDSVGQDEPLGRLLAHLTEHVGAAWRERTGELLRSGVMDTRSAGEFVLYRDSTVVIKGNANGSSGYLYVCAYLIGQEG